MLFYVFLNIFIYLIWFFCSSNRYQVFFSILLINSIKIVALRFGQCKNILTSEGHIDWAEKKHIYLTLRTRSICFFSAKSICFSESKIARCKQRSMDMPKLFCRPLRVVCGVRTLQGFTSCRTCRFFYVLSTGKKCPNPKAHVLCFYPADHLQKFRHVHNFLHAPRDFRLAVSLQGTCTKKERYPCDLLAYVASLK
jgi:hypothetical protein